MSPTDFKIISLRFALIACFFMPAIVAHSQNGSGFSPGEAEYLWPTNASQYMSSTFGETRSAHFHSALDLKTWGQKGYEVYATRDGILHRIGIGPTGYGKVVYLKHNDGSYSVYAHLLRFEDEIQQMADSIRFGDYSFELDQWLGHLQIPVKQGQVIGLTGASGIGPPHLHFELRTPEHHPFNPLLTNLEVKDSVPPQFSNLSIEPLSIDSNIEGGNRIYTKRVRRSNGNYSFGTVNVAGPIGLGIDVFDQADGVYNAYAVYELKMFVNGELHFHSKIDRFSYEETGQMLVDRVYPILKHTRAGYQRLYIANGNTLPFYANLGKSGKLNLKPGLHEVRIVASDYFGNTSEATLQLNVREPNIQKVELVNAEKKQAELNPGSWQWFGKWVNVPREEFSNITVAPLGKSPDRATNSFKEYGNESISINLDSARDIFFGSGSREHFIARQIVPQSSSVVPSTTDGSFALFEPHTFYDTLSVGIVKRVSSPDSVRIHIFPDTHPTRKSFRLAVEIDSTQLALPHLGLYSYNERKKKLSYLSSYTRQNYLWAEPDEPGLFYLLQDTTAPAIRQPKLVRRTDGQWLAYATVTDDRSGIDHQKAEFYINGIRGIAEFEPEDNRLVYYHPDFTPSSQNNLRVVVYDKEGHRTEKHFYLTYGN